MMPMIYLVTKNQELFTNNLYQIVSIEESIRLLNSLDIIGVDTETSGLDCWQDKLLLLQMGNYDNQVVVDCRTVDPIVYKELLESNKLFLFWNAKFDLKFLYRVGIYPNNVYDGFLAEKLLWLGYPSGMHSMSLKSAGQNYLGVELDKSVRGKIIWCQTLTDDIIEYGAHDVKYLEAIMDKQKIELEKKDLLTAIKVENEFVLPLSYCEYCGIKLDKDKWKTKMVSDKQREQTALNNCVKWILDNNTDGRFNKYIYVERQGSLFDGFNLDPQVTINWNSAKQLIPIFKMYDIDLSVLDKETKATKDSIDAKVLKPQKDKCSLIPIYLEYKEASKVTSTYGENFLKQINPVSGRIHTSFQQLGADTTRITSGGKDKSHRIEYVNLLNLPSDAETRACFVAEEGNKWVSIDYTSQETFLMASIANDKAIIDELENGSGDIHSLTAYMSYKEIPRDTPIKDIKRLYHDLRQKAKGIEFTVNYGGDANTIHQNSGIPLSEAKTIYNDYMSGFKGLCKYQEFRRRDWLEKGYILLNGRTRHKAFIYDWEDLKEVQKSFEDEGFWSHYREMKKVDKNSYTVQKVQKFFKRKSTSEKQSINYPIQASGSMCLRFSMIYFFKWIKQNNLVNKVKICVTPYDEINCETPAEIAEETAQKLYDCMVKAGKLFCTRCHLDADISRLPDGTLPNFWIH